MVMKNYNRFEKGSGTFICRICGKRTRSTSPDNAAVQLCTPCMEHEEAINAHNDNGHENHPERREGCPICKEMGLI